MDSTTAYPNLGFDPCAGSPESVSALQQRISTAATSMRQANDLVNRLRNDRSGIWARSAGPIWSTWPTARPCSSSRRGCWPPRRRPAASGWPNSRCGSWRRSYRHREGDRLATVEVSTPFVEHGPQYRTMVVTMAAGLTFQPPDGQDPLAALLGR